MVKKVSIYEVALRNGYINDLNFEQRKIIYARMATGRQPLGANTRASSTKGTASKTSPTTAPAGKTASSTDKEVPSNELTYYLTENDGESTLPTMSRGKMTNREGLIDVEVCFVDDQLGGLVKLPEKVQFPMESTCGTAEMCERLNETMKQTTNTDAADSAISLFNDKVVNMWTWELWVLPHGNGGKKLSKFSDGNLAQFVGTNKQAKGNGNGILYVEAHVVAKAATAQETWASKRRKVNRTTYKGSQTATLSPE